MSLGQQTNHRDAEGKEEQPKNLTKKKPKVIKKGRCRVLLFAFIFFLAGADLLLINNFERLLIVK